MSPLASWATIVLLGIAAWQGAKICIHLTDWRQK